MSPSRVSTPRVLVVHNRYLHRGGEDVVVDAEVALLREHGHEVVLFERGSDQLSRFPPGMAMQLLWNSQVAGELRQAVDDFGPDVVHVHNTFPFISPAAYSAVKDRPVVQTLHNFRLMCLNALFLRDGKACEDCMGHLPWRGVARACYRDSRPASAALAAMLALHRGLGTYGTKVSRYIALNEFCRGKFIAGGLPAERIVIKPNFVDARRPAQRARSGLLFVGRLSAEKGIHVLAGALGLAAVKLRAAGEGPEGETLRGMEGATLLGALPAESVRTEMEGAVALVLPSICYENFPRTIVEAFSSGLPVIASRIGALAEIVTEGRTGLLFEAGNPADLAAKMAWALAHPGEMAEMGRQARVQYEREFTPEVNYGRLMEIYRGALAECGRAPRAGVEPGA